MAEKELIMSLHRRISSDRMSRPETGQWTFQPSGGKYHRVSNPQSSREFERAGEVHSICREPIQNSLDAVSNKDAPVVVEIGIWDEENAGMSSDERDDFFGSDLRLHIRNAIRADRTLGHKIRTFDDQFSFITIEDFNTVGLLGDPKEVVDFSEASSKSEEKMASLRNNRFMWYNRAQNATSDDHNRRGSWGEGKLTLEAGSRIGAQITWSIREEESEPKQVLMGQSTLVSHEIFKPSDNYGSADKHGNTKTARFDSFGYFSTAEQGGKAEDWDPQPLIETSSIEHFRDSFKMTRQDETGTSIVIPYPQEKTMDPHALARSCVAGWILAIHSGQLVVNISLNGQREHSLSRETLRSEISDLAWHLEKEKTGRESEPNPSFRTKDMWLKLVDLLDWNEEPPEEESTFHVDKAGEYQSAPSWNSPFLDHEGDELARLRAAFEKGEPVRIVANPRVHSKKESDLEGRFDVIMIKARDEESTQLFAREGMTIPFMDIHPGCIAFVHCYETDLLRILRDSEGPAHLKFEQGANRIKGKAGVWERGRSTILYVNDSVKHLLGHMKPPPEEADTKDDPLFTITLLEDEDMGDSKRRSDAGEIKIPPPKQPDVCRIYSRGSGGAARIRHHPERNLQGSKIRVNLAYDTAKGNPWKKYREHDFTDEHLELDMRGLEQAGPAECRPAPYGGNPSGLVYVFEVTDEKWKIDILGLDNNRDVAVDVKEAN